MPQTTALDNATHAANDLLEQLCHPAPASPFLEFGNEQHAALQQLADMFKVSLTYSQSTPSMPQPAPQPVPRVEAPTPVTVPTAVPNVIPNATPVSRVLAPDLSRHASSQPVHWYPTRLQSRVKEQQHHQVNCAIASVKNPKPQHQANPVINKTTGSLFEY